MSMELLEMQNTNIWNINMLDVIRLDSKFDTSNRNYPKRTEKWKANNNNTSTTCGTILSRLTYL